MMDRERLWRCSDLHPLPEERHLERRELVIEAVKSQTRTARIVPMSSRLKAVLEMRRTDPSSQEFGPA
jgi:hypothetical protein